MNVVAGFPQISTLRNQITAYTISLQQSVPSKSSEALTISVTRRFPALHSGDPQPVDPNEPIGGRFLLTTDGVEKPVPTNGASEQGDFTPMSLETSPREGGVGKGTKYFVPSGPKSSSS